MNLKFVATLADLQPVTHTQCPGAFNADTVKLNLAAIHCLRSQTACLEKSGSPQPLIDAYGLSQLFWLPAQAARREPLRRGVAHRKNRLAWPGHPGLQPLCCTVATGLRPKGP